MTVYIYILCQCVYMCIYREREGANYIGANAEGSKNVDWIRPQPPSTSCRRNFFKLLVERPLRLRLPPSRPSATWPWPGGRPRNRKLRIKTESKSISRLAFERVREMQWSKHEANGSARLLSFKCASSSLTLYRSNV